MLKKAIINLTSTSETYTAAAGGYEINGMGGNDTITTGAGDSIVTTGVGNSTITTGAGDSLVHTLDGNQTITTGAGNNTVTTGVGNSTITTGAGISIVLTGNGNNTITTGAGASHITTGAGLGDDTITAGAGDAIVDSGLGNDTVTTAAGNDLVSYHVTGNTGMHSVFNGGTGIDTLNLAMTRTEWMSNAVQTDVASYLSFLAANKGTNGEDGAAAYTFKAFGLTASMFEKLQVTVDGVILQDATNSTVLVDDLHGGKASQVVSMDITNPNHAPVANPDVGVSINSDGSVPVSFTTSGTAYQNGAGSNEYVITQALNSQVGALWSNTKVSLDKSFSVSAELYFGNISNGADGFSFIMQNQSKSIVGQAGEGLGYAGISNSVGVAFDTYYNAGTIDILQDHTEINTGGRMNGVGGVHVLGNGNVKDGKYHAANIDWDASTQKLRVSFDGVQTDNQQLDLASLIGSKEAYVGFAGSTGGLYNLQKINTLSYHSTDNSVVLDVLANDTDVDPGDKVGLKVVSASSEHGATVSFSGVVGTGITYSPGHSFDNLAFGQKVTDVIHYTIEDSHGAMSSSTDIVTIVGVAHLA